MTSPVAEGGGGRFGAKIFEQKSSKVVGQTHLRVKPLMYRARSSELLFLL